jgi:hypothetical protein
MELGYGKGLIWLLFDMTGPSLPPYLLEVIMKTGDSYYVHSLNVRDEERKSLILNVYDFRAVEENVEKQIKSKLDDIQWGENSVPGDLHPLLTIGRLRCDLDEISYCVEWYHRWWTLETLFPEINEDRKRALGFKLPSKED